MNLFEVPAGDVLIDLLTDSGTGAMSRDQWAAVQHGDESYAGSPSWSVFLEAVQELFPFEHVIPTHQGRAAERILFSVLGGPGKVVPEQHALRYDTGEHRVHGRGGGGSCHPGRPRPHCVASLQGQHGSGSARLAHRRVRVGGGAGRFVTVTNNTGGGQPVSLENLRGVRAICDRHGIPLFLDACRFAENAWFIQRTRARLRRRQGRRHRPRDGVARRRDDDEREEGSARQHRRLAGVEGRRAGGALPRSCSILTEGFPTYGGLAGRDLEAIAQGLKEAVDHDYLRYRIRSTAYLGEGLQQAGLPVVQPVGGHAVYIDARAFLPHIPPLQYPGQALAVALYIAGGIRGCEIGTVMFGRRPDGSEAPAAMDLVRLAVPRRTYTQSHVDYVIEIGAGIAERAAGLHGLRITSEPQTLRHFTAQFEELPT